MQECELMASTSDSVPTTIIRPRHGWASLDLPELVRHHELLYFLVWRDLKVRYKQTVIGVVWAVLQPVLFMGILTIFLGGLEGISPTGVPYHLFVLAGLVPWALFSQSLASAGNSLVDSGALLTKVYFPRLLVPLAAVGSHSVDFLVGVVVLAIFAVAAGFPPSITWMALVPLGVLALAAAAAVGLWLAALNVRYRDFRYVIPFIIQVWFFATPIAYSVEAVPDGLRALLALNPLSGVVAGFRWAITGGAAPLPDTTILVSAAATAVILAGALAHFRRVERNFADII